MARQTHACEQPAISLRFQKYALLRYHSCFEHVQISLRFSRDPPREICLRFRQVKMAAKNMNQGPKTHTHTKKKKKKVWKGEEEEILISEWSKFECLYKTSSPNFLLG